LNSLVLDASVAIKWAMPLAREPLTDESLRLLKRYVDGEVEFIVPDVFWAEVGNVLWEGYKAAAMATGRGRSRRGRHASS